MSTYQRHQLGKQFFDDDGNLLAGGLMYHYEAGTTSDVSTFSDAAGATANSRTSNAIVLDASGRLTEAVYFGTAQDYKERLETSGATLVYEEDDIPAAETAAAATTSATAKFEWANKSASETLTASGFTGQALDVDTSGASRTMTLPSAVSVGNGVGGIIKKNSASNTLTIDTQSGQTIDGASSLALTSDQHAVYIISDGANYKVALEYLADGAVDIDRLSSALITGQTALTSVDRTADYLLIWDADASAYKKVAAKFFPARREPDDIANLLIIDKDLTAPPGSESEGDRYIVGSGATGGWASQDGKIASYFNGAYAFYTPSEGWLAYAQDENKLYVYDGSSWVSYAETFSVFGLTTPFGAKLEIKYTEEEVTLSGATTDATFAFPNQSLACGVSIRVTELITASGGGASFSVGDSGSASRYGSGFAFTAGTTGQGTTSFTGKYGSDDQVRFTVDTGAFTGGKVRIAAWYMVLTPPTA